MNYIIYQIRHKTLPQCYIGTTSNYYNRVALHKCHSKYKESLLYNTIRANGGFNEYEFVVLEEYSCGCRRDAESRENYWIKMHERLDVQLLNSYKLGDLSERENSMARCRSYYWRNRDNILAKMKGVREAHP